MPRACSLAVLTCIASLFAGAATAQQPAPANPPPATAQPANTQPAVVHRGGLQKTHDGWRASQILGATVYSDTNQGIGGINDLIVSPDGKITEAVISVGGFLGIGSKLVGVPFSQLRFEQRNARPAATSGGGITTPGTTTLAPTAANTAPTTANAPAPATHTMATANPPVAPAAGPAVAVVETEIVLPGATKDSLTAMPDFKF